MCISIHTRKHVCIALWEISKEAGTCVKQGSQQPLRANHCFWLKTHNVSSFFLLLPHWEAERSNASRRCNGQKGAPAASIALLWPPTAAEATPHFSHVTLQTSTGDTGAQRQKPLKNLTSSIHRRKSLSCSPQPRPPLLLATARRESSSRIHTSCLQWEQTQRPRISHATGSSGIRMNPRWKTGREGGVEGGAFTVEVHTADSAVKKKEERKWWRNKKGTRAKNLSELERRSHSSDGRTMN